MVCHCVRWDGVPFCTHTCDPYTGDGCAAPQECLSHLARNREIGLCELPPPACDIYDPQSCPEGEACRPLFRRNGFADNRCQSAGPQDVGEPCAGDFGQCQPGLNCIRNAETQESTCYRVCQEDADCREGEGRCLGRTLALGITFCR